MKNTLRKVRLSKETLCTLDEIRLPEAVAGAWPTRVPSCPCTQKPPWGGCH